MSIWHSLIYPALPLPTISSACQFYVSQSLALRKNACHPLGALVVENLIMPSNRQGRFMSPAETVMIGGVSRGFCMPPGSGQAILCKIAFPII